MSLASFRSQACKAASLLRGIPPAHHTEGRRMDVVFTHCAGLDGHKKRLTACRLVPDPTGQDREGVADLERFGTMTIALLALGDWLTAAGIPHGAMERTGEYWNPVYNLLEG